MAYEEGRSGDDGLAVIEHRAGVLGLRVVGEVDAAEADACVRAGAELLRRDTTALLIVDLSGVHFFGSRGLTALLRIQAAAREAEVPVRVVTGAANRTLTRPLAITGLDRQFALFDSLAEAVGDVGSPR